MPGLCPPALHGVAVAARLERGRDGSTRRFEPAWPDWAAQHGFDLRFDWGPAGIERLAPHVGTLVLVDVLRFTTAVETAVSAGALVYPYQWRDATTAQYAESLGAIAAERRAPGSPSLSPPSLAVLAPGTRVVLPSPNGAVCTLRAAELGPVVAAGCLRNAAAIAAWLRTAPRPAAVIGCGEVSPDGTLRPALEDLVGAGSILSRAAGRRSPEADAAVAAYQQLRETLRESLCECASARELLALGWNDDVVWSLEENSSDSVPVLNDGCYIAAAAARIP